MNIPFLMAQNRAIENQLFDPILDDRLKGGNTSPPTLSTDEVGC